MKTSSLILATALSACSVTFAATTPTGTPADTSMSTEAKQPGDTLGDKTKRGAHKVGEAINDTGHRIAAAAHRVMHPRERQQTEASHVGDNTDMRTTDAAADGGRQVRMDSAYANWQTKRKS